MRVSLLLLNFVVVVISNLAVEAGDYDRMQTK